MRMHMYGVNVEPTIGLNPGEGMPILTLGLRYQLNRLQFDSSDKAKAFHDSETGYMTDQIYGVFVGVLYKI